MDMAFRWKLLGLIVAMGVTAIVFEYAAIGGLKLITWAGARRGGGGGGAAGRGSVPHTVTGAMRMDRR
ncbi:hypothetical protein TSOC_002571 [Tetrabaena socialis]|uniref:Uncharacterized protein n=1 Tax=Tetrabaena socialis TaxID=47790 RepID=A0A2J8ADS9_9CHLO|nr:hypothetical protein TSOC_002571 [Tetrabaena socialis]|eukprot:PNH10670.1 hypothetical protein TSOC_002571 [Tetrabaena socialis]